MFPESIDCNGGIIFAIARDILKSLVDLKIDFSILVKVDDGIVVGGCVERAIRTKSYGIIVTIIIFNYLKLFSSRIVDGYISLIYRINFSICADGEQIDGNFVAELNRRNEFSGWVKDLDAPILIIPDDDIAVAIYRDCARIGKHSLTNSL